MPRFKSRPPHFPRVLLLLATGITAQRFSSILFGSSAEISGSFDRQGAYKTGGKLNRTD
jgi:hypothetical protein